MGKYYIESRRRGISYIRQKGRKANWIGHILRKNHILKHITEKENYREGWKRWEDMEEDVSSYWTWGGNERRLGIEIGSTSTYSIKNYGPGVRRNEHLHRMENILLINWHLNPPRVVAPTMHYLFANRPVLSTVQEVKYHVIKNCVSHFKVITT